MRDIIYLRRGTNGKLERTLSLTPPVVWSQTDLSEETEIDTRPPVRLEAFFDQLSNITEIDEIDGQLDLTAQYAIGRKLCRELGEPPQLRTTKWLHLIPVTEPEDKDDAACRQRNEAFLDLFCRIPWNLVTRSDEQNPIFLGRDPNQPGSITLQACRTSDGETHIKSVRLPPFPRVLLVIPVNEGNDPTFGAEHHEKLRNSLAAYDAEGVAERIAHVTTFEDFKRALKGIDGQSPDIVYFYGHADADMDTSWFVFDSPNGEPNEVNIDDIKLELRECVRRRGDILLAAVWINACKGAAARGNSFLRFLSPLAGTVLATRTLAPVEDSRAIAETALESIAVNGEAPHVALRTAFDTYTPPVTSGRWAATVVSVQYELWSALDTETRRIEDVDSAGDFPVRLDRASALSKIEKTLRKHFDSMSALPLSIGWRGDDEQRIDIFKQRVADLLPERLHRWPTMFRKVDLQFDSARDPTNHFFCSIWCGLLSERGDPNMKTPDLADLRRAINRLVTQGTRALFLEHGPFTSVHVPQILQYMEFWKTYYEDLMPKDHKLRLVLAFGFKEERTVAAGDAPRILQAFVRLGPVPERELKWHLTAFGRFYRQASGTVAATAEKLIADHEGSFRKIHAALEKLAEIHAWPESRSEEGVDT